MLDRGDEAVLVAPTVDFYQQLDRIPMSFTSLHAVTSTNGYADETLQAELDDLRAALREAGKTSNDVERVVLSHAEQRAKLQKYSSAVTDWKSTAPMEFVNGIYQLGTPPEPRPTFPSPSIVDGLPGEFADYFAGAIAWNNPAVTDKSVARQSWEHLLNRPPEERHYKSTWAAYMLGRSWEEEDAKKAREYYQQVRALAAQGFADSSGLAATSLGQEARLALEANEFETALDLYLQQYAAGSPSASTSLEVAVARVADLGPKAFAPLVVNPQQRKLTTAYLISRHPYSETTAATVRKSTKAWLEAVEQANVKDVDLAEQLALAAYQADDMDAAIRWVTRAGNSPTAQWLTAKLLLRAGKIDKATQILSQIVVSFPTEQPTNDLASFGDSLFVQDSGDNERVYAGRYIRGELGALRLSRREYTQALDLLLHGDFWPDAAYVADHVLTTDELQAYVDANWPAIQSSSDDNESAEEKKLAQLTSDIRYLLARRLTRESHIADARQYFPAEWSPNAERLMQALTVGWDESLPGEQRAKELVVAAFIARTNGMELMATEAGPDWHMYDGNFEGSLTVEWRTNRADSPVTSASNDELKRNAQSVTEPDKRFHYRYQAAELAWEAAKLMPNNSDDTARLLCTAGAWLKYRDPDAADRFYKDLVRRCRKTAIGIKADEVRWFPDLDADGNVAQTRLDLLTPPSPQEIANGENLASYPTPGKHYILIEGDRARDIVLAVRRLGSSITVQDLYDANPNIEPSHYTTGREIFIPRPAEPEAIDFVPNQDIPTANEALAGVTDAIESPLDSIYTVKTGDTLATIAKQSGLTISQLLEANSEVDFRRLKVGQTLIIPK